MTEKYRLYLFSLFAFEAQTIGLITVDTQQQEQLLCLEKYIFNYIGISRATFHCELVVEIEQIVLQLSTFNTTEVSAPAIITLSMSPLLSWDSYKTLQLQSKLVVVIRGLVIMASLFTLIVVSVLTLIVVSLLTLIAVSLLTLIAVSLLTLIAVSLLTLIAVSLLTLIAVSLLTLIAVSLLTLIAVSLLTLIAVSLLTLIAVSLLTPCSTVSSVCITSTLISADLRFGITSVRDLHQSLFSEYFNRISNTEQKLIVWVLYYLKVQISFIRFTMK